MIEFSFYSRNCLKTVFVNSVPYKTWKVSGSGPSFTCLRLNPNDLIFSAKPLLSVFWTNHMLKVTESLQVSTCRSPVELLEFSSTNITELSPLSRTMAGKSCILHPVPGMVLCWRIVMMCCCLLLRSLWTYRLIMRPFPWNSRKPRLLR